MLARENITIRERDFVRVYSDTGMYIRQVETGNEYTEAVDLVSMNYTYEETTTPIETEESPIDPETHL